MGFGDGPESKPSGIISITVGSLMIQLAYMPAEGRTRDAKKLRRAPLILARLLIDKAHMTFDCTRQREITAVVIRMRLARTFLRRICWCLQRLEVGRKMNMFGHDNVTIAEQSHRSHGVTELA